MSSSAASRHRGVWAELVGQGRTTAELRRAVAGGTHAMTHAWLLTGPPGSGRSNAARAFAAALQCPEGGCGQCTECRTSLSGAHPDVTLLRTEKVAIGVQEVRDLVRKAAMSPTLGRYQVIVIEDADRITERGADALLKSIEEPAPRTVWMLCAPTADDVVVTVRSRCRVVRLSTPSDDEVTRLLIERDGIEEALAFHAARAAQGHIGRARLLARDEQVRTRRHDVLKIPSQLTSVGACLVAAAELVLASEEEAKAATAGDDAQERADLQEALGGGTKGARPRNIQAVIKELENEHKARLRRLQRDALDRVLSELATWYRDVLLVQTGVVDADDLHSATGHGPAPVGLINAELRSSVAAAARGASPAQTLRRIDAILDCREALEMNVAPLLAFEALLLELQNPGS